MEETPSQSDFSERSVADGVVLFRRKRSAMWQARIRRVTGQWFTMSTKTSDFEQAKATALVRQRQLQEAQRQGLVDVSRRFSDVAKLTAKQLQDEIDLGMGRAVNRDYIQVINRYLIPCLGKHQIHTISHVHLLQLDKFRDELLNRHANRSTINTHNAALNRVFKTAVDRGFMLPLQVPALINRGAQPKSRPYFDRDDYIKMATCLQHFVGTGHKNSSRQLRTLLADYVLILANSGMRPGREALGLKWNQIKRVKIDKSKKADPKPDDEEQTTLEFTVTGKRRQRTLVCRDVGQNVSRPLKRIQSRFSELKDLDDKELFKRDEHVFRTEDGKVPAHERLIKAFKVFLKKYDLLTDKGGNVRSLYSLRHTYATTELQRDTSLETLRVQMGTSITMIERHYSKIRATMARDKLSGWQYKNKKAEQKTKDQEIAQLQAVVSALLEQLKELRDRAGDENETAS